MFFLGDKNVDLLKVEMKPSDDSTWTLPEQHFKEQKDRYYFVTIVDNTLKEREAYDFRVLIKFDNEIKFLTAINITMNGECISRIFFMFKNVSKNSFFRKKFRQKSAKLNYTKIYGLLACRNLQFFLKQVMTTENPVHGISRSEGSGLSINELIESSLHSQNGTMFTIRTICCWCLIQLVWETMLKTFWKSSQHLILLVQSN